MTGHGPGGSHLCLETPRSWRGNDHFQDRANQIGTIMWSIRSKKEIIQGSNDFFKQLSIDFTQCFTINMVSRLVRMVNI